MQPAVDKRIEAVPPDERGFIQGIGGNCTVRNVLAEHLSVRSSPADRLKG